MVNRHSLIKVEASRLAIKYGNLSVESVTLIENIYLIMTSCSIFIHSIPTIDNCNQLSKRSYQTNPITYIQRKKKKV